MKKHHKRGETFFINKFNTRTKPQENYTPKWEAEGK